MHHGTSSIFLDAILERGLLPEPTVKLSELMAVETKHTVSLPGTYMALDRSTAASYARQASLSFGGEPMVVVVSADPALLIPDEDEVHFSLSHPLCTALGFDDNYMGEDCDMQLTSWGHESAINAARGLLAAFGWDDGTADDRITKAAEHLHAMLDSLLPDDPVGKLRLLHPDYNAEGWDTPAWVRKLTSTAAGMTTYRREIDALCRSLIGANVDNYPCGAESCKGRVTDQIGFDAASDSFICALGDIHGTTKHFDGLHFLEATEIGWFDLVDDQRQMLMAGC